LFHKEYSLSSAYSFGFSAIAPYFLEGVQEFIPVFKGKLMAEFGREEDI